MIGFFPELYEDELVYSWFARYHVHSGYTSVTASYIDLYANKSVRPSIELLNSLSYDAAEVIRKHISLKDLLQKHTMFPEYARFIDPDKRKMFTDHYGFSKGSWNNALKTTRIDKQHTLKYCPICATEDRKKHGETYWHCKHQITGIRICNKHRVLLKESSVIIDKNLTRFKPAEISVPDDLTSNICSSSIVLELATYLEKVFTSDKYSHNRIGRLLNDGLDPKYHHDNGNRFLYKLYGDYRDFYSQIDADHIMKIDYLTKMLKGNQYHFYYVCQIAMFEHIPADELLSKGELFKEENVFYRVSVNTGEPLELVEKIGTALLEELKTDKTSATREVRYMNYITAEDERFLPKVQEKIKELYGFGDKRPKKITVKMISTVLGIDFHKFKRLTKCVAEVEKYHESQEQYWAREIIWAIEQIKKNDEPLNYKHIRNYTNMRRDNVIACLKELKMLNEDTYQELYEKL